MLSIEACQKILGKNKYQKTDKEIEEIRDTLYQLANILYTSYKNEATKNASINLYKSFNR